MSSVDRFSAAKQTIGNRSKTPVSGVGDEAYYVNDDIGLRLSNRTSMATNAKTDPIKSMSATEAESQQTEALTPGASGLVLGLQMPRVGLGIGVFGANAMSDMDAATVLTITSGAAVAALNPACKRVTIAEVGHVGVDVNLMPIPIPLVVDKGNDKLSQKQETYHVEKALTDPPIKMCHI